jgi:hypothetical protein
VPVLLEYRDGLTAQYSKWDAMNYFADYSKMFDTSLVLEGTLIVGKVACVFNFTYSLNFGGDNPTRKIA